MVSPPPGAVVVKTSFRDNPSLSEELRIEVEHLKATDPDEFEYVYGGMCRQAVAGAVYRNELLAADKEGRICRVPYDASKPVDTFWDLATSITLRSGWLSLSVLSFGSSTSFRGNNRAFSITYASFSPAPMLGH